MSDEKHYGGKLGPRYGRKIRAKVNRGREETAR